MKYNVAVWPHTYTVFNTPNIYRSRWKSAQQNIVKVYNPKLCIRGPKAWVYNRPEYFDVPEFFTAFARLNRDVTY
jgi:hypothetical protein